MKAWQRTLVAAGLSGAAGLVGCEPTPIDDGFLVEVLVEGPGRIVSAPIAIDCAAEDTQGCQASFLEGTRVTLQARPDAGFIFSSWTGDCEGSSAVFDFALEDDTACTAFFVASDDPLVPPDPNLATFTVTVLGGGVAQSTPEGITCGPDDTCSARFRRGTTVDLAALAGGGSSFYGFSGDCIDNLDETASVVIDGDVSCGVSFLNDNVRLPVRFLVTGRGTVQSSPLGIQCTSEGTNCEASFPAQTEINITASAESGWHLREWGHTCAGLLNEPSFSFPLEYGLACSAAFAHGVSLTVGGGGRVTSDDAGTPVNCTGSCGVDSDRDSFTLRAIPSPGYRLIAWSGDCVVDVSDPLVAHVDVSADNCGAAFETIPPELTVTIEGNGSVRSGNGTIDCPATCVGEVPSGGVDAGVWICSPSYYGDGTCDCGCGILDVDCTSGDSGFCDYCTACGSCESVVTDRNHLCSGSGGLPTVLTATADDGWVFAGWTGACGGTSEVLELSLQQSDSCTARFVPGLHVSLLRENRPIEVNDAVISADDDTLAVITAGGFAVVLLDAATGRELRRITVSPRVLKTRFAQDGTALLTSHDDNSARLWDLTSEAASPLVLRGHSDLITGLALSSGELVATSDRLGRVKLWSRATGLVERTIQAHEPSSALGVAFVGDFVVSAGGDKRIVVTRAADGVQVDSVQLDAASFFRAGSDTVAVGTTDLVGTIRMYRVTGDGQLVVRGTATVGAVLRDFSLDVTGNAGLAVLSTGGLARFAATGGSATSEAIDDTAFSVSSGNARAVVLTATGMRVRAGGATIAGYGDGFGTALQAMSVLPSGDVVTVGDALYRFSAFGTPRLLSTTTGDRLVVHGNTAWVGATYRDAVLAVDLTSGASGNSIDNAGSFGVAALAISADGTRLAVGADDDSIAVTAWELPVGDLFRTFPSHAGRVTAISFLDGRVITACSDGFVRVLDMSTAAAIRQFTVNAPVTDLARATGSETLAILADSEVLIASAATAVVSASFDVGCEGNQIALAPDAAIAAVACSDGRVRVLDVASGDVRASFAADAALVDLAFVATPAANTDELVTLGTNHWSRWLITR